MIGSHRVTVVTRVDLSGRVGVATGMTLLGVIGLCRVAVVIRVDLSGRVGVMTGMRRPGVIGMFRAGVVARVGVSDRAGAVIETMWPLGTYRASMTTRMSGRGRAGRTPPGRTIGMPRPDQDGRGARPRPVGAPTRLTEGMAWGRIGSEDGVRRRRVRWGLRCRAVRPGRSRTVRAVGGAGRPMRRFGVRRVGHGRCGPW